MKGLEPMQDGDGGERGGQNGPIPFVIFFPVTSAYAEFTPPKMIFNLNLFSFFYAVVKFQGHF